jgi:uncharacterized protein YbjQ (UPF0145 family)
MLVCTSGQFEGYRIIEYLAPVGVDVPIGRAKSGWDNLTQNFGFRSAKQHTSIDVARDKALSLLEARADQLGGNAVVGMAMSISPRTRGNPILWATGTVVRIAPVTDAPSERDPLLGELANLARAMDRFALALSTAPLSAARPPAQAAAPDPVNVMAEDLADVAATSPVPPPEEVASPAPVQSTAFDRLLEPLPAAEASSTEWHGMDKSADVPEVGKDIPPFTGDDDDPEDAAAHDKARALAQAWARG